VIPTAAPSMDRIGKVLQNLVLTALNDTTVLQQLTTANLALTALVTLLMTANKKLADTLVRNKGGAMPAAAATPAAASTPVTVCSPNRPFPGNYCLTHGHRVNQTHTSASCTCKAAGYKIIATTVNMMGGSKRDKGWNSSA
jgi:hypothetical protein